MHNYIFITVGRVGSSTDLIEQKIEFVNDGEKRGFLLEILNKQCVRGPDGKVYGSGSCSDHGFKLMVYHVNLHVCLAAATPNVDLCGDKEGS